MTATARPDTSVVDVITALFLCGSVTGAPKIRSTEIIRELEPHLRGIYTGVIGFLSPNGDAFFNVAIRTVAIDASTGSATFGVGGGITWESTAEGEYEECLLKASFLTRSRPEFCLFETLALVDGVYQLLDRHLSRAQSSACYFGFRWNEIAARAQLDSARDSHPVGSWRVRLLIDPVGTPTIEAAPLAHAAAPLVVKLAHAPVDESDPLIFHKISERSRYQKELDRRQPCDDVILWNSRGEVTESSIARLYVGRAGRVLVRGYLPAELSIA